MSECDEVLETEWERGRWGAEGEGRGRGLEKKVYSVRQGGVKLQLWMFGMVRGP